LQAAQAECLGQRIPHVVCLVCQQAFYNTGARMATCARKPAAQQRTMIDRTKALYCTLAVRPQRTNSKLRVHSAAH